MSNKPNKKQCPHHNRSLKVINIACGCETTVIICDDCKKELTKPKTDC